MFGIRSEIPVMPAIRLLWEMMTPFGMPVDPLVYMMTATSEGNGGLRSRAAGMIAGDSTNTRKTSPTPGAGKTPGWNADAVEMFKDSGHHVWGTEIFRCFQTEEKSATGCSACAASGIS